MKKVELNIINAYVLDPKKKYIMVFDSKEINQSDAHNLLLEMKDNLKVSGIGIMLEDIDSFKIIEATEDNHDRT